MSDRLKYPVECADCGLATCEPTIAGYGKKLCHDCLDIYNKDKGLVMVAKCYAELGRAGFASLITPEMVDAGWRVGVDGEYGWDGIFIGDDANNRTVINSLLWDGEIKFATWRRVDGDEVLIFDYSPDFKKAVWFGEHQRTRPLSIAVADKESNLKTMAFMNKIYEQEASQ